LDLNNMAETKFTITGKYNSGESKFIIYDINIDGVKGFDNHVGLNSIGSLDKLKTEFANAAAAAAAAADAVAAKNSVETALKNKTLTGGKSSKHRSSRKGGRRARRSTRRHKKQQQQQQSDM
jgi:hypothetical protein